RVEDLEQVLPERLAAEALLHHQLVELTAEQIPGPPEVGLEDLAHVHTARNAARVQDEVDRRAVRTERHVLLGQDAAADTLVPVASGHLVADLELPLDGDVDLHHLDDARRELVSLAELADLLLEERLDGLRLLLELLEDRRDGLLTLLDLDVLPVLARDRVQL